MARVTPKNLQPKPVKFKTMQYITFLDASDPKRKITPNPAYEFSNGRVFTKRVG